MKDIIIVGAGGFGREAYYLIQAINAVTPTWHIKGFISDIPVDLKEKMIDAPILGTIKDWQPSGKEVFAMGISSPKGKEKVAGILKSRGAFFETLIGPKVAICPTAVVGEGSVITYPSTIGDFAKIGSFVNVAGSMIGQDAQIGDFSTTTGYANVTNATLGKRVFVGSHAVILNNRKIGDDAFICAGSIVFHNVKSGTKVFGNPAKKLDF